MKLLNRTQHLLGHASAYAAANCWAVVVMLLPFAVAALSVAMAADDPAKPKAVEKIVAISPQAKNVTVTQQYVCKIHAWRHIEVRALGTGYIQATHVKEGQAVKKGDLMFEILPVLYKARADAAIAERTLAELELNATKKLANNRSVSPDEVRLFEAKLAKAKARADLAEAELNFTKVRAPFDGLVDIRVQEGSLVAEGDSLGTLSDTSMMWVYFEVPEARYLEHTTERKLRKEEPKVELALADGKKFGQVGKINAIKADFNNETGTISYRADFPNPERLLRHGQRGTVLISRVLTDTVVIPQRATFEVANKRYVYVIDNQDVAHRREIVIQNDLEDPVAIKLGIGVDDKIILEGVRQVRDGEKVEYEDRSRKKE
jgi:membrane fusion protein, multidrug efflux system